MKKNFNLRQGKKAFSLGEVLISVFILGITMVTILQLFVVGLKDLSDTRDSIIAYSLAKEGLELVRNIRDNNWANGNASFNGLTNSNAVGCSVSYDSGQCIANANNDADLRLNYVNGFYTHGNGGVATKFRRKIRLVPIGVGAPNGFLIVTSQVSWGSPSVFIGNPDIVCKLSTKCIYINTILTKWGE